MGPGGVEPPRRDFQSPALPVELQALRDVSEIRTHDPRFAVWSLTSLATTSYYGTQI